VREPVELPESPDPESLEPDPPALAPEPELGACELGGWAVADGARFDG
jgi:hypothetical protein